MKIALFSPHDIGLWIKALEEKTYCNYSIRSSRKCTGQRVKFKQLLYCHHNTGHKGTYNMSSKNTTKNTNCPSSLTVTLQAINKKFRGDPKNAPDPEKPCIIRFVSTHNHSIVSADALRFRHVSEDTKMKLINLYNSGHTPATALESLKIELQLSNDNFELLLGSYKFFILSRYVVNDIVLFQLTEAFAQITTTATTSS